MKSRLKKEKPHLRSLRMKVLWIAILKAILKWVWHQSVTDWLQGKNLFSTLFTALFESLLKMEVVRLSGCFQWWSNQSIELMKKDLCARTESQRKNPGVSVLRFIISIVNTISIFNTISIINIHIYFQQLMYFQQRIYFWQHIYFLDLIISTHIYWWHS